ncbi:3'(2'),5'-bisphosphate nucleotidase CysQ [Mucilaginibacter sp. RCC_168]|uniref:3'(2'),5'-bisphosphate nucleotidase CysQ n=1 Tax=Mucilaginibacter sp. RCC_168 TaxID=3239221 RepID=UPI003525912C
MIFTYQDLEPIDLTQVNQIAKEAGAAILSIYNLSPENIGLTLKDDQSPLTAADKLSHEVIFNALTALTPQIPIISEEGRDIPYETRKNWPYFWCADPLDGTKEFIKHNGEFTVNIALIHQNTPVLGIIYIPVTGELYYGGQNIGSWKESRDGTTTHLHADVSSTGWIAAGSRSHASPEETAVLSQYPVKETISVGSSLKFCLIAEGRAHIYYRHGPTMEWDTAAGQAIATFSGAKMTLLNGEPFLYNKVSLLNQGFLCKVK